MLKIKLYTKAVSFVLIVTILFVACDVPDISKFTETSAEMTRGISKGVQETGTILETTANSDFVSQEAKNIITEQSKDYDKKVKPTLKALNSLDSYLEALNALAQSNKKSGENAAAVVSSVGNLVTAVGGLQLPETAIKLGTVAVTLFNQIKTAKDFKKRVTLVELIVNGSSSDSSIPCTVENSAQISKNLRLSLESMDGRLRTRREAVEAPLRAKPDIETEAKKLAEEIKNLNKEISESDDPAEIRNLKSQKESKETRLKDLKKGLESIQKIYDDKIKSLDEKEREEWLTKVGDHFCGIIDILKLNMEELDIVQKVALDLLYNNTKRKSNTLIGYHDSIITNDEAVQRKISFILRYKSRWETLQELILKKKDPEQISDLRKNLAAILTDIYVADGTLKPAIAKALRQSDGECMKDAECDKTAQGTETRHNGVIILYLEDREMNLMVENARLITELDRIKPQHEGVISELTKIKSKQKEMNALFKANIEALDTWGETHSNLRVSLNTKKPLTVSKLLSKTREIWDILKPEQAGTN